MGNFCLKLLKVFWLLCLCPLINPSNILVVSPVASKSHFIVGEAITIGLRDAGHDVTLISPFDYKPKNSNIEHIHITGLFELAEGNVTYNPNRAYFKESIEF